MFSLTLMSKGEKRSSLDVTVGGPSSLAQPLRVSINVKGGYCWHVLQERVCLSLMERIEGGAEGRKRSRELTREDQNLRRDGTIKLR